MKEKDFGFLYFGRKRWIHVARIDCPFKWGICEHHVVPAFFGEGLRERVHIVEARSVEAVQHEVHAADAQHRHAGITVVAGEAFRLREFPFLGFQLATGQAVRPTLVVIREVALVGVRLKEILPSVDEKAACTGSGIDDALSGLAGRSSAPSCG